MPNLQSKNEDVSDEVVDKTQERLTALNFGDLPDQPEETDDSTSDEQGDENDQTDDSESKDDTTVDDQEDSEEDGSKDKDSTPEVQIPEGYLRAARRQGWSDEDIEDEIKNNPDRAKRLFENAYQTTNKLTRDFAAIGRTKADAIRKEVEERAKLEAPKIEDYLKPDEIDKIADGDETIAATLKAFNSALKKRDAGFGKLSVSAADLDFAKTDQIAATERAKAAADETDVMRINQFFGAENMKLYNDFYGTIKENQNIGDLTPNQRNHRIEVLQIADQLRVGKMAQGTEISVAEALEDAHLLVTESMREKVLVDGIRSSLKKRSKTLRPSISKKTSAGTELKPAKDRAEVLANAEARLSKLNFRS